MFARSSSRSEPDAAPPQATDPPPRDTGDPAERPQAPERTRAGAMWAGMILSALVLVMLLVFIVQSSATVSIYFLAWDVTLPIGVALLLAAVAGVLIVAIPGTARILQLRRNARSGLRT